MATAIQDRQAVSISSATEAITGEPMDPPAPALRTHFWFTIIFLIYAVDWADRSLISTVLPSIREEFGLTDAKAGLLSGFLFVGLGVLAVPTGVLVDRFSRKYMIVIMTAIWSAAVWSMGRATSFAGLASSRLVVGAGEAGYNPAGYALISAWYPQKIRGTMVGIFNIAQPLGGGMGAVLAGWLTLHFGWRSVFGVMAIPGFVLAALMLFAPDYNTVNCDEWGMCAVKAGPRETLRFIFGNRTLLLIFAAQVPIVFYIYAATTWTTTFFMRTFHINVGYAASLMAMAVLFVSVGPAVCGWLSDRLTRHNPAGRVTTALILLLMAIAFHSLEYVGPMVGLSLMGSLVAASLGQFCIAGHWGSLVAAGLDLVPLQHRASCQSFFPLFQSFSAIGAGAGAGLLSDRFGLAWAMELTLLFGFGLGFLILRVARRSYLADYERQISVAAPTVEATLRPGRRRRSRPISTDIDWHCTHDPTVPQERL